MNPKGKLGDAFQPPYKYAVQSLLKFRPFGFGNAHIKNKLFEKS